MPDDSWLLAERSTTAPLGFSDDTPLPRFVVGIDLGTTNSAMACIDTSQAAPQVQTVRIPQLIDWGSEEPRETLPSFYYQLTGDEQRSVPPRGLLPVAGKSAGSGSVGQGGPLSVVGELARFQGLRQPGRQIASAKSWLSHAGVDRQSAILPWRADEDVQPLSPVEASASYLRHLVGCWNRKFPDHPLAEQQVVLTLPASFDETARRLTVEAAKLAGLPRVTLIEEPQAAFYAWLGRNPDSYQQTILPGQSILVCDIGGGTTDFTLIRVASTPAAAGTDGSEVPAGGVEAKPGDATADRYRLHRVAVGQHLILGGDNLDLSIARLAEAELLGAGRAQLPPRQWDILRQHAKAAKETLLGASPPASYTIHLPSSGSSLLAGAQQVEMSAERVQAALLEGFFPWVTLQARPQRSGTGFQEFGLPYAEDPAITRHLADFLWQHRWDGRCEQERSAFDDVSAACPQWILFNGGVLESPLIRRRLTEQLHRWFAGESPRIDAGWQVGELTGNRLDLAVAHGAAYFGWAQRGHGLQIESNLARAYYLQISADPPQVVCLVPGRASAGESFRLDQLPLELEVGEPVALPLWVSSRHLVDQPGQVVPIDDERMLPMPPIRTVIEAGVGRRRERRQLPVVLEATLSQIGTLELACQAVDGDQRWGLEFDVRSAVETDRAPHTGGSEQSGIVDSGVIERAGELLDRCFGEQPEVPPNQLLDRLRDCFGMPRAAWPPSLLRGIWRSLMELEAGRGHSAAHEARWLNLAGFALRPGFGMAADDWRVSQMWRSVRGQLRHRSVSCAAEAIILWRRIAGGFTAGQQLALFQELRGRIKQLLSGAGRKAAGGISTAEGVELLRLVGSLERLPLREKHALGGELVVAMRRRALADLQPALLWTLGRLGSRLPTYGPLNLVVAPDVAEQWLEQLLELPAGGSAAELWLAAMLLARRTGDRYRDVSEVTRQRVMEWLEQPGVPENYRLLVAEQGGLTQQQQTLLLGEALPLGIRIRQS